MAHSNNIQIFELTKSNLILLNQNKFCLVKKFNSFQLTIYHVFFGNLIEAQNSVVKFVNKFNTKSSIELMFVLLFISSNGALNLVVKYC